MTTLTATEQMYLELINRARLDPLGEAKGMDLNRDVNLSQDSAITSDPKQPLAGSNMLTGVAETHLSHIWATTEYQTTANMVEPHNFDGTPQARIAAAGYIQNQLGRYHPENFASDWNSAPFGVDNTQLQAMINLNHNGLFTDVPANFGPGAGHRLAMLDPNMKEAGIAEMHGQLTSGKNAEAVIENFGVSGTQSFLTGAVYNDKDGDHFYSLGEAVQGVTETVATSAGASIGTDVTGSGGGWTVAEPATAGTLYSITFSGAGLASVAATVDPGILNAKIDLVNANEIDSSVNTTLGAGAVGLRMLGVANINGTGNAGNNVITGNAGNNVITGGGGNDTIDGGAGTDTAVFSGKQSDYQITVTGGTAVLHDLRAGSPDGTDTITNIEAVQFSDATVAYSTLKTTVAPVAGSITIDDVTVTEGNNGTTLAIFHVSRSGGTAAFDVHYATADGTATVADSDYAAQSNALHFNAGDTQKTISVVINGDTKVEASETFSVNLSGATNGATIADGIGIGTIANDDVAPAPVAGSITIDDVTVTEGNNGTSLAVFHVSRSGGTAAFDVHYATADGTATVADNDYATQSDTLHFNAGDTQKTISVVINGDTKVEADETFSVNLSAATNGAKIADGTGIGTIANDDVIAHHAAEDFNGDGNSDILFHNDNGAVAMWQMNGTSIIANQTVGTQATAWHAEGTGDFNGDGKADILWQNDNGQVQLWQMNGATPTQVENLGSMGTTWHIGGVGDFNGNGKADALWFNDAGQVQMQMDGATTALNQTVGTVAAGWHIQGAADFTGDGKADILLRNDAGATALWQMDGNKVVASQTFGTIGTDWHFAGAADFGGDGKADILWQNDNGSLALWQMNGTQIVGNDVIGHMAAGWHVADVGDYNHDGHADILLQNAAGAVAEWQMNGAHINAIQNVGAVSTDWHTV